MADGLKSTAGRGTPLRRSGKVFVMTVLGVPLLCSGCAFQRQAAGIAIDHNEFVAQTTNRQTVLNILRASQREPMHFTSFSSVGGRVQAAGTLGLNTAINGDGGTLTRTDTGVTSAGPTGAVTGTTATQTVADALTRGATNLMPSASVTVTTGTDFQIGINATDDFYRGIMGPLSSGIIVYYLRQNFPADLLSHLVVGRIELYAKITPPNGPEELILLRTIHNTPDDAVAADAFTNAIRCRRLAYAPRHTDASTLPVPISNLSGLTPEVLARLSAVTGQDGQIAYQLETPARNELALAMSPPDPEWCGPIQDDLRDRFNQWREGRGLAARAAGVLPDPGALTSRASAGSPTAATAITEGITGGGGASFSSKGFFDNLLPPGYKSELVVDMTIRSVEGVLYYLGEYVRGEDGRNVGGADHRPMLWSNDGCAGGSAGYCLPIIRVRPAAQIRAADRFVDVEYRGRLYAVPLAGGHLNAESGRSSQSISLVQQLLNLHRSSKDLPSTPLVRIAN